MCCTLFSQVASGSGKPPAGLKTLNLHLEPLFSQVAGGSSKPPAAPGGGKRKGGKGTKLTLDAFLGAQQQAAAAELPPSSQQQRQRQPRQQQQQHPGVQEGPNWQQQQQLYGGGGAPEVYQQYNPYSSSGGDAGGYVSGHQSTGSQDSSAQALEQGTLWPMEGPLEGGAVHNPTLAALKALMAGEQALPSPPLPIRSNSKCTAAPHLHLTLSCQG